MSDESKIEWTGFTWNPTTGCDKVSPGCGLPRFEGDLTGGCYAMAMAKRLKAMGQAKYQTDGDPRTSGPGFGLAIHPDTLDQPRRWAKPRLIFVNSMSDLFHARVPLSFVRDVFDVAADTPQHTYQVLTKRSLRLARIADQLDWPPNLWMGVSVENAGELRRVDHLRRVPAAVRFLSCEPLLGPVSLRVSLMVGMACDPPDGIGWVIAGGESGPGARPMHPNWVRTLRDQCQEAGVPFFFKQWGEWCPIPSVHFICQQYVWLTEQGEISMDFKVGADKQGLMLGTRCLARLGKPQQKRLGISSLLDGREWSEFPNPSLATNH